MDDKELRQEIEREVKSNRPLPPNVVFRPTHEMRDQIDQLMREHGAVQSDVLRAIFTVGLRRLRANPRAVKVGKHKLPAESA